MTWKNYIIFIKFTETKFYGSMMVNYFQLMKVFDYKLTKKNVTN